MIIKVIASSSKGNMTIFKLNNNKIIAIDCGVGIRKVKKEINNDQKMSFDKIDYLFLTHGHSDHIKSFSSICSNFSPEVVYLTNATFKELSDDFYDGKWKYEIIKKDKTFVNSDFSFTPIGANHDFRNTVGFVFYIDNLKISYLTDSGFLDFEYIALMKDSDAILLEANHDTKILENDLTIDYSLKKRIGGINGHLSNDSFCQILDSIITKPTVVIAMHISEERNNLQIIRQMFETNIKRRYKNQLYLATSVQFDSLSSIEL
jgi:phosphoribosyl 1,2-cyclic phosphodiesterase